MWVDFAIIAGVGVAFAVTTIVWVMWSDERAMRDIGKPPPDRGERFGSNARD